MCLEAPDGYVVLEGVLPHEYGLPQGAHEGGLHRDEQLGVAHPDVPRHVPGEIDHRHNRLISLRLVPLVPECMKIKMMLVMIPKNDEYDDDGDDNDDDDNDNDDDDNDPE